MKDSDDEINYPVHYTRTSIEPIDVIETWNLPHHLACVVKYIARYRDKENPVKDLRKASWYLNRYIGLLEEI